MKSLLGFNFYSSGAPAGCVRLNVDIAIPRADLDTAVAVLVQRALSADAATEPAAPPPAKPVVMPFVQTVPAPTPAAVDWQGQAPPVVPDTVVVPTVETEVIAMAGGNVPRETPKARKPMAESRPSGARAESAGSTLPDAQVRKAMVAAHRGGKDASALMRTPWRMADGRLLRFKRAVIDEVLREAGANPTFASVLRDVPEAPPQELGRAQEPEPTPAPAPTTNGVRPARKPIALTKDALARIKERIAHGVPLKELARESWPTTWGEARTFSAGRLEELIEEAAP